MELRPLPQHLVQVLQHPEELEVPDPVGLATPQLEQVVADEGSVKFGGVVSEVAGSGHDDAVLAEDDALHLLDVELALAEGEVVAEGAHYLPVDHDLLVSGQLATLEAALRGGGEAVGGVLQDNVVGDVELDVVLLESGDGQLQPDHRVLELAVADIDGLQREVLGLPVLLEPLADVDVLLGVGELREHGLTIRDSW